MQFGSNEMKELLILAYNDPNMYEKAMIELHESVKAYTLSKIKKGFYKGELGQGSKPITTELIEYHEYDDIVDDIFCNVIKSLDNFVKNIEKYSEAQRQAWLRTIIHKSLAKFLTSKKKNMSLLSTMDIENESDEERYGGDSASLDISFEDLLKSVVKIACTAKSKPEKIMAFVFNIIIFRELSRHKYNGNAQATSNFMNGKKLFVLKNSMIELCNLIFGVAITYEEIKPLVDTLGDEKPTEKGQEICETTPKKVADWSCKIKTHIFEFRAEIFGEEGESNVRK